MAFLKMVDAMLKEFANDTTVLRSRDFRLELGWVIRWVGAAHRL